MGLRYRIPFVDGRNVHYEVQIFRKGYTGAVKELTGAPSCFVVNGTDEDFMYTPVRTSTATISVIDSDLLLDLYSINNQYAQVKLYREGVLEWTGYIKPEQFTQPYVPTADVVNVECVGALATLEYKEYEGQTLFGTITLWTLLKYLINSANGGYRGVYIPHVYGLTAVMNTNVFEKVELIENNFTEEEMNLLEVLEAVCKLLNWTIYEHGGCLWFVDADWHGEYRLYDEALNSYTSVTGNEVLVQDVGFCGSDGNTLDVVPGYNKASVKAINHVFDDVVKDEPYDVLKPIDEGFYVGTYEGADGAHGVRKQFLKPMLWRLYQYADTTSPALDEDDVFKMVNSSLNKLYGGLLLKEADYKCVSKDDPNPAEDVTDFEYTDSIQIRVAQTSNAQINTMGLNPALLMKGEHAVYADCAISIDGTVDGFFDDEMLEPGTEFSNKKIVASVECDGMYYNGTSWVASVATLEMDVDDSGRIKSNRTPFTPYKNISGYVIPMEFFVGEPTITIFCPVWMTGDGTHCVTGTKIRNLKFGYAKKDGVVEEGENGDRVYENIVNEAYMSECEEIEFGISSYNADGATYSKALLNGRWLTEWYCAVVGEYARPEELMIRRIVNRYGVTKIKLTEALWMTGAITPISILRERTQPGKVFRLTSGTWDYERCRLTVQIQEDVE